MLSSNTILTKTSKNHSHKAYIVLIMIVEILIVGLPRIFATLPGLFLDHWTSHCLGLEAT